MYLHTSGHEVGNPYSDPCGRSGQPPSEKILRAQASQRGDKLTVHSLQQQLIEAEAARLLAVRWVTEENHGKDTPGVDGVKSLTPPERLAMASTIEGAFDHVNQTVLLNKLQTSPALRRAINGWLTAGVMDGDTYFPSETGLPREACFHPC